MKFLCNRFNTMQVILHCGSCCLLSGTLAQSCFLSLPSFGSVILMDCPFIPSGHSFKQGEKVDSSIFEMDPGQSPEPKTSEGTTKSEKLKTVYRCKKCRRVVAAPENVVSHTPGEGESCFGWQKSSGNRCGEVECSSMFVEPLKWMTNGMTLFILSLMYVQMFSYLVSWLLVSILQFFLCALRFVSLTS